MTALIRYFALIVSLLMWAVIGAIFWLPLVGRTMAYYSACVVAATFRNLSMHRAQERLEYAVTFYGKGFRKILEGFDSQNATKNIGKTPKNDWGDAFKAVSLELISVVLFWSLPLWLILPSGVRSDIASTLGVVVVIAVVSAGLIIVRYAYKSFTKSDYSDPSACHFGSTANPRRASNRRS